MTNKKSHFCVSYDYVDTFLYHIRTNWVSIRTVNLRWEIKERKTNWEWETGENENSQKNDNLDSKKELANNRTETNYIATKSEKSTNTNTFSQIHTHAHKHQRNENQAESKNNDKTWISDERLSDRNKSKFFIWQTCMGGGGIWGLKVEC